MIIIAIHNWIEDTTIQSPLNLCEFHQGVVAHILHEIAGIQYHLGAKLIMIGEWRILG